MFLKWGFMFKMNILLTHYIDLDGIAPIILSKYFELPIDQYIPVIYGEEKNDDEKYIVEDYKGKDNIIFITDFSISVSFFNYIKCNFKNYFIFDHHEMSLELPSDDNIYVDISKSGTLLFYEWLIKDKKKTIPEIVKHFVDLINIYDTWNKGSPLWEEAQNLNRVLWKCTDYEAKEKTWQKFMPFIHLQLSKFEKGGDWYWTDYEHNIIQEGIAKEQEELLNAEQNMKIRIDNRGNKFILYYGSSRVSIVCSKLLEKYDDIVYIININTFQGGNKKAVNGKVSVRAREGFDVNNLHNIHGHKQAGGGKFPELYLVKLWNGMIKQIPYVNNER